MLSKSSFRVLSLIVTLGIVVSIAAPSRAAVLSGGTVTVTFDPDTGVAGDTTVNSVVDGIPDLAFFGAPFNSTTPLVNGTGGDFAQVAGGADHSSLPGPSASANLLFPYGLGALQDNDTPSFNGSTKLTINTNLTWDVGDGWTGPIFAYQYLSLSVVAPGSSSVNIVGDFNLNLTVNDSDGAGTPLPVPVQNLHYESFVTNSATPTLVSLFDSAILTFSNLPNIGLNGLNTLNITGSLTFTSTNDDGPASVNFPSFPVGMGLTDGILNALNHIFGYNEDGHLHIDGQGHFIHGEGGGLGHESDFTDEDIEKAIGIVDIIEGLSPHLMVKNDDVLNLGTRPFTMQDVYNLQGGLVVSTTDICPVVVPLPGAFGLGLVGLGMLAVRRRHRVTA